MKTTSHEVNVRIVGFTWGGFLGECDYLIKPSQQDDFKCLEDFKTIAGDFETITSAVVTKSKTTIEYDIIKIAK